MIIILLGIYLVSILLCWVFDSIIFKMRNGIKNNNNTLIEEEDKNNLVKSLKLLKNVPHGYFLLPILNSIYAILFLFIVCCLLVIRFLK